LWATCQISESPHAHHTAHNCMFTIFQDIPRHEQFYLCRYKQTGHTRTQTPNPRNIRTPGAAACTRLLTLASLIVCCTDVFLGESGTCRRSSVDSPAPPVAKYCPVTQPSSCLAESTVFSASLPRVLPDTGLLLASQHCTMSRVHACQSFAR
jgi:hypothetical protein